MENTKRIHTRSIMDDCRLRSIPLVSNISEPRPDSILLSNRKKCILISIYGCNSIVVNLFSFKYVIDVCGIGGSCVLDACRGIARMKLKIGKLNGS